MLSPARVASRHLAGLFEAPPAMIADIREWMFSVYAGHVLAGTIARLAKFQDSTAPAKATLERILATEKVYEQEIRDLEPGEDVRFDLPIAYDDGPKAAFVGVRRAKYGGNLEYQVGQGSRVLSYSMAMWTTLPDAIRQIEMLVVARRERAERTLRNVSRMPQKSTPKEDEIRVELNLLRRECLKYTSKPKAYAAKAAAEFPVDLTGWKYVSPGSPIIAKVNKEIANRNKSKQHAIEQGEYELERAQGYYDRLVKGGDLEVAEIYRADQDHSYWTVHRIRMAVEKGQRPSVAYAYVSVPSDDGTYMTAKTLPVAEVRKFIEPLLGPDDVSKAIAAKGWKDIKVVLDFKGHTGRGGIWFDSKRELQVDVSNPDALTVKSFHDGLRWLDEVVRHEVQHLGQTLLGLILDLKEEAGLPSDALRDFSVTTNGHPRSEKGGPQRDHALRDVEFYTDLADAVGKFEHLVRGIDPRERADAVREFVGLPSKRMRLKQLDVNSHFSTWKSKAPEKWRKAVAEFVKALEGRGVRVNL